MYDPRNPQPFYNRERELRELDHAWSERSSQLVTVWGRRRVGKSLLLSRFSSGKRSLYLYGTRLAEQDILAGLSRQVASLFRDSYLLRAPFPSWPVALEYLANRSVTERLLFVIDEFSYLCEVTPGLDTLVQQWWDSVQHRSNLMLVLTGSAFSFLEGLFGGRGPLHGRRTAQLEVTPFDFHDSAYFYSQLAPVDRVRTYGCFGGIPAYLQHLDQGAKLDDLVLGTLLTSGHFLFREGEELLRTEFHQEALYASILRAIAHGRHRPSDIARAVGRSSADEIFDHLRRLLDLRFIRREVPVTELNRPRTQRVLYRLADPYLRFWYRFVSPFQSFLQLGRAADVWQDEIAPVLDQFIASTTWEDVCVQHLWRRLANGDINVRFTDLGRWWDNSDEIDLVGTWRDEVTLVGECKWTNEPVDLGVLNRLAQKASKLNLGPSPTWVLASRTGFDLKVHRRAEAGDLILIEPSSLWTATTNTRS